MKPANFSTNPKTIALRKAVSYLAEDRRCSHAVARHIIECWPKAKAKRFIKRYGAAKP